MVMLTDGPEDEAYATANRVIEEVAAGRIPVAVVVEDRLLLRRVRALLERRCVGISDETGWNLATTLAAARVMSALRAASSQAGPDDWLDWLKNETADSTDSALDSLELAWRRHGGADSVSAGDEQPLWRHSLARLRAFVMPGSRTLAAWCTALSDFLGGGATATLWSADEAGRRVRQVLSAEFTGGGDAIEQILDLDDFVAWASGALERASFVPQTPDQAHVVLTPLRRALLRPFTSVILPGADQGNLGTDGGESCLLPENVRAGLDLPDRNSQSAAAARDFIELLRSPRLMILRHREVDGEANPASAWVQRTCALHRCRSGRALDVAPVQSHTASVLARPVLPPRPSTAGWLPLQVSATHIDSLRQCPHQFFSRSALGLRELEDLSAANRSVRFGSK